LPLKKQYAPLLFSVIYRIDTTHFLIPGHG